MNSNNSSSSIKSKNSKKNFKTPSSSSTLSKFTFTSAMSTSIPFPIDEVRVRPVKSRDSQLDINDPNTFRPRAEGIHVDLIMQHANICGWLTKHKAPSFSFIKNVKRRYCVLVDRMLYTFKSESPDIYREFLELNVNTNAFVTDQITGALYCIEIKKLGYDDSWFLQADDAETMKLWLDRIKRTITLLRSGHASTTITKNSLSKIMTEEEEYVLHSATASASNLSINTTDTSTSSITPVNSNNQNAATSNNTVYDYYNQQQLPNIPTNTNQVTYNSKLYNNHNTYSHSQPNSPISSSSYLDMNSSGSVSSFQSAITGFSYNNNNIDPYNEPIRRNSSFRMPNSRSNNSSNNSIPTVLPPQLPPPKSQPPPIPSYAYL